MEGEGDGVNFVQEGKRGREKERGLEQQPRPRSTPLFLNLPDVRKREKEKGGKILAEEGGKESANGAQASLIATFLILPCAWRRKKGEGDIWLGGEKRREGKATAGSLLHSVDLFLPEPEWKKKKREI